MPKSHSSVDEEAADAYARLPDINGYPERFSVFPDETVTIHAACKPPNGFEEPSAPRTVTRIEIRDAVTNKLAATVKPVKNLQIFEQRPANYRDGGADYKCCFHIDTTRLSAGPYECVIADDAGRKSREIYFNVKPRNFDGCDLVCVLPSFTWQAYNRVGGGSFYSKHLGPLRTVSSQRPATRREDNFIAASIPFLALFRKERLNVACIDSSDLHFGLCPQGAAPVVALLTHDEYWTDAMRAEIERFLHQGSSLLVMAGNVCWWHIEVDGNNISVNKTRNRDGSLWCARGKPEETTFVASFRFGGYPVEQARAHQGMSRYTEDLSKQDLIRSRSMTAVATEHPLFRGVALEPDNSFGGDIPIMYREIDGVPLTENGAVDRSRYKADAVSPEIIATGVAVNGYADAGLQRSGVIVEADVGGGHVLHMGTFGWSLGLEKKNETVKRILLNAYRHCRTRQRAVQNFTGSRSVQVCSRIFQPPRFCFWKRKR